MNRILQISFNIGLLAFLIPTSVSVIIYFGLLYEKMVRPQFKNMNSNEVLQFGALAIVFLITDIFIIRRFWKLLRKTTETGSPMIRNIFILTILTSSISFGQAVAPFSEMDFPDDKFIVKKEQKSLGAIKIEITQVSPKQGAPQGFSCRAWLTVRWRFRA